MGLDVQMALIEKLGHRAILPPPAHVRRYRTRKKTDRADAKALLEAFRNGEIRPVPVKTPAQQTLAALHRLRSAWLGTRTARLNAIRRLLREQGLPIPLGERRVVPQTLVWVEDAESTLPAALRCVLFEACAEVLEIDERLRKVETQLEALAKQAPLAVRLRSVPGVGLLTATALAGFVGDLTRFSTGRHFASDLGLTPREHSSGSTRRRSALSKRGDVSLRMLLAHGARPVLAAAPRQSKPDRLRAWALELATRVGHNQATIALANKLARYTWAVATQQVDFERRQATT